MFRWRACLSTDLIYELPSKSKPVSPATFATNLQETLAEAYHQLQEHMSHKLDRQKAMKGHIVAAALQLYITLTWWMWMRICIAGY